MSLPLPVFRLDTRTDLPFEPLCTITLGETAGSAAAEAGFFSRVQQWFGHPRGLLSDDVEGG